MSIPGAFVTVVISSAAAQMSATPFAMARGTSGEEIGKLELQEDISFEFGGD